MKTPKLRLKTPEAGTRIRSRFPDWKAGSESGTAMPMLMSIIPAIVPTPNTKR